MAGRIKHMLDEIIRQRSASNPMFESTTRTKLVLKGLDPAKFSATSADDPAVISKVMAAAAEMGITLR